jgi:protoporphyrinogen/coproporphyrinogen III oxidase
VKVVVVGGGVAGLTAAVRLVQAGVDVRVLEGGAPGGVLQTRTAAGFVHELAANGFLAHADGAGALCAELGVPLVGAAKAARKRWIYIDGALRQLPTSPLGLVRTDLLTWRGKVDLLREPFRPARDVDSAGDESVHAFAARRFGPEAARAVVAPFVTGVFAADAHDISLAAGFPRMAAMDRGGGIVRSMLAAMRRRPRGTKAVGRGLSAPKAGMAALVDALAKTLGTRLVRLPARAVTAAVGGVVVESAAGAERADAAVLATPAVTAAALVEASVPELAPRLREIHRAPAAIVFLGFDAAAVKGATVDGFGFLCAQGEDLRVLGVVFESTVWPGRAPAGTVLLRCIFGGARDPRAAALPEAELVAHARADLAKALGLTAAPVHVSVARWPEGIAQYPVGHRDRVATLDSLAGQHRLVLAGADYHGIGINDVVADARRVVTRVQGWT